jgi:hypothetical protein
MASRKTPHIERCAGFFVGPDLGNHQRILSAFNVFCQLGRSLLQKGISPTARKFFFRYDHSTTGFYRGVAG